VLDLTVLVPTRNEAANVLRLFDAIEATLGSTSLDWQVMFVDDSDDETVSVLASMAAARPRCALLHRFGPERVGGLSGAVVAGLHASSSRWVAVMDGDLQHPPAVLPALVAPLIDGTADVVVASRYRDGACPDGLSGSGRRAVSSGARTIVRALFPRLHRVTDPLGGFFAMRRAVVADVDLQPWGFKILMEILQRGRWATVAEVPYTFAPRGGGKSKASLREGVRFVRHATRLRLAPVGAADIPPVPAAAG
jgi:glycosyltransferase involved in cell wall biosynthesis